MDYVKGLRACVVVVQGANVMDARYMTQSGSDVSWLRIGSYSGEEFERNGSRSREFCCFISD